MDADEAWARAALEPGCVMAFPAPAGILAGAGAILAALEAAPRWQAVDLDGHILAAPDPALRGLADRAEARARSPEGVTPSPGPRRAGGDPDRAFSTSVWRQGAAGWRLVQHQQAPA